MTRKELLGRRLGEAIPSLAGELHTYFKEVLSSDKPLIDLEITHTLAEIGDRQWRVNLSTLKDAERSTQGVAIVLEDLTERRRLEAQRRLLNRMVSPAVVHRIDPDTLQLGGQRTEVTILFADLRGFNHQLC